MAGIFIGIGANLAPDGYTTPKLGCEAAIACLPGKDIAVTAISTWYETAPVPVSGQPWFNNAVIAAAINKRICAIASVKTITPKAAVNNIIAATAIKSIILGVANDNVVIA